MIYDVSAPIDRNLPIYPGDPAFSLTRQLDVARGDEFTVSALRLGVHFGAHVDAPAHYFADGLTIEQLTLETLIGPAYLLDLTSSDDRPPGVDITIDVLARQLARIRPVQGQADGYVPTRLLLKTPNSALWRRYPSQFAPNWVGLEPDAATWLIERGVRLVGIDYMSIEPATSTDFLTHRRLLGAGVAIVEGLDLSAAPGGWHELICLPLRLVGAEAAPARCVLRSLPGNSNPPRASSAGRR